MAKSKTALKQRAPRTRFGWIGLGALALVLLLGYLVYQNQQAHLFTLERGDKALVILLRDTQDGVYTVRYNGRRPVDITGVQTMLAGEILHMDVEAVSLEDSTRQVVVVDNQAETPFRVQPGATFRVRVTFSGQTLGYNYLYGFRLTYTGGSGAPRTFDATDQDFRFLLTVE